MGVEFRSNILTVVLISSGYLWQYGKFNARQISDGSSQIIDQLDSQKTITSEMEVEIEALVRSKNLISSVKISNQSDMVKSGNYVGNRKAKPDYHYNIQVWAAEWLHIDFFAYGNGVDQWYIGMEERSFNTVNTVILFVGLAIYWTLFSIWAIINVYHHKRLNIG